MNRPYVLALVAAAILAGCGDTKSAGGTGSDFPQPMARLLDTNLEPVSARVWRLWRVDATDTARDSLQVVDTGGFRLPASGLWIVEAWTDSVAAGSRQGLAGVPFHDTSACSHSLTYLQDRGTEIVGVLPCLDLAPPSVQGARKNRPLGVGVFGALDSIQRVVGVPGPAVAAFRFQIFRIAWDSIKHPDTAQSVTGTDSVLLLYSGQRTSLLPGTADITAPAGDWMFQGWVAALDSTNLGQWSNPPPRLWANEAVLRSCTDSIGGALDCTARPTSSPPLGEPDVFFVVHSP
ncbi:MAG TPA: hypothetical protein VN931_04635 [Fibrobacteria bacterium]|nr:hypothetical protein [Fibrobacteria bacterium]